MESEGKQLLPKIMEVVSTLRHNNLSLAKPVHTLATESSWSKKDQTRDDSSLHKLGSTEFDLTLPIDLPGLVSVDSKKVSMESSSKVAKLKQKHTDSSVKVGGMKVKTQVADCNTPTEPVRDVKTKEREKEGNQKLVSLGESKKEVKTKPVKPQKVKEEIDDKGIQDKQKEIVTLSIEETSGRREKGIEEVSDSRGRLCDGAGNRKDKVQGTNETKESIVEGMSEINSEAKEILPDENCKGSVSSANGSNRCVKDKNTEKRPLPPRRRSARLASVSEDKKKDEPSDIDELNEDTEKQQFSEDEVQVRGSSRTRGRRKRKALRASTKSQKRSRIYVDYSSDDSGVDECFNTKRRAFDQGEKRQGTRKSMHRKRPCQLDQDAGCSKRAKTLSRTASPASTTSSSSSALAMDVQDVHHKVVEKIKTSTRKNTRMQRFPNSSRGTSKSPMRSPPPPAVVTRYNRHVKPNRWYCNNDTSEEEKESLMGDSSGQSDDEGCTTSLQRTKNYNSKIK